MTDALHSRYIINGCPQEFTPAELLDAVSETKSQPAPVEPQPIIDESLDAEIGQYEWRESRIPAYRKKVSAISAALPVPFAGVYSCARVATALIDSIWRQGRFRLDDLVLTAKWTWNGASVGNMAAFYDSVRSTADYIDALHLNLRRFSFAEGEPDVKFATPFSGAPEIVGGKILPREDSWLVYVPFDTADYRLGGSLLAQAEGRSGGISPQISDADYFVDCYEVVRELAEDGIILGGVTVGEGGLARALDSLCSGVCGACVDIAGIMASCEESNPVRVLFGEVPGALFQIADSDFDYIDAEFLLQDVAWFPLGHPDLKTTEVEVNTSAKTTIQTILETLMQNAEGED